MNQKKSVIQDIQTHKGAMFNNIRGNQVCKNVYASVDDPWLDWVSQVFDGVVEIYFDVQSILKQHIRGLLEFVTVR